MKTNKILCCLKSETLFLGIIILVSLILTSLSIKQGHNWGSDFSLYISQAIAINNNSLDHLYEMNKFSMEHSEILFGPYLYPPGFPLILSAVYFFTGMDLFLMKWVCALFFLSSLPLIYKVVKKQMEDKKYAIIILVCVALHSSYITFTDNVLSDLPFLFFSFLSLFLMERCKSLPGLLILGAVIYFTYIVRDIGVALLPTLFVYQFQNIVRMKTKLRKDLFLLTVPYIVFIFLFAFSWWLLPVGGANHYSLIKDLAFSAHYFEYYLDLLSTYLFDSVISVWVWIPLMILLFTGILIQLKKGLHIVVYSFIVILICLVWPSEQGIRFLFPVMPFLLLFIVRGYLHLSTMVNAKYLNIFLYLFAIFVVFQSQKKVIRFSRIDSNTIQTEQFEELYTCIEKNTKEDDIIEYENPRVLRLFTKRNSFYSTNRDTVLTYADYAVRKRTDFVDEPYLGFVANTEEHTLFKVLK